MADYWPVDTPAGQLPTYPPDTAHFDLGGTCLRIVQAHLADTPGAVEMLTALYEREELIGDLSKARQAAERTFTLVAAEPLPSDETALCDRIEAAMLEVTNQF